MHLYKSTGTRYCASEPLVLQEHVVVRLQAHASAEQVHEAVALREQRVHDRRTLRDLRGLRQVAQDTQDRVHMLKLLRPGLPERDALGQLREDEEVQDQR